MGTTWADSKPQVRTERANRIRQLAYVVIEFSFSGSGVRSSDARACAQRSCSTAACRPAQWRGPRDSLKVASRLDRGRKNRESRGLRSHARMKSRRASPLANIAKLPGAEYTSPEEAVCATFCTRPCSALPWFCAAGCCLTDVEISCWLWAGAFACKCCLETAVLTFWPTNML